MRLTLRKMRENPRHTSYRFFVNGAYAGDITLHTDMEAAEFVNRLHDAFDSITLEDWVVEDGG